MFCCFVEVEGVQGGVVNVGVGVVISMVGMDIGILDMVISSG